MRGIGEHIPLRTGLIQAAREWGEFINVEEPDGTLHAWSQGCHVIVLPGAAAAMTLRTATVKNMLTGRVRLRRMVVARLGGAWLHVLEGHLHFSASRMTLAQVDAVKTPLPPADGNTYEAAPVAGVRLTMQDRRLILSAGELPA